MPDNMDWFIAERSKAPAIVTCAAHTYIVAAGPAIRRAIGSRVDPDCPLLDPRRVYLAALILGTKFLIDNTYTNKSWSLMSGLDAREISRCERTLSEVLQWRLWFDGPGSSSK
jgi:hypothetical protein